MFKGRDRESTEPASSDSPVFDPGGSDGLCIMAPGRHSLTWDKRISLSLYRKDLCVQLL